MSKDTKKPVFGNAAAPEFVRVNGKLQVCEGIRIGFTKCFTCNNMCGLRYRVDEKTNTVTRVAGNPYCEVVTGGTPLPLSTPVAQAYEMLTGDSGLAHRATSCGKGASGPDSITDPRRVTQVLKRVGKRGENKWKTISYEQALKEIVEGGNLFGEGHVDGLRKIRDLKTPALKGYPEFGSAANQLFATFNEEDAMRGGFYRRFISQAFGSVNLCTKHAYCGASVGVGYSLGLAPEVTAGMCDVDWDLFEYAIFMGTSPGSSGASINRLGRAVADARVDRKVKYVCVDPILRNGVANNTQARWQPILPGSDTAFLYGLIRTIFEEKLYLETFLRNPNEACAKKNGEINWTNATLLIDVKNQAPALASDFGLGKDAQGLVSVEGKLANADTAPVADLFVDKTFKKTDGSSVRLVSSLELLRQEAMRHSMKEYSALCGASIDRMQAIAREFCSHNRRVVAVSNVGNNGADAVMSAWLICILNTLAGSHDIKGGALYGNGAFMGYEGTYNLAEVDGAAEQSASMNACRSGPYEDSTEYKQKLKAGKNPYPASHVYHPMNPGYVAGNAAELFVSIANRDPYAAKALINWRSNVLYSASSVGTAVVDAIKDPKTLPLFVAIDAFINETNRYADYIIPDLVMYEEYACDRTWGNFNVCVVAGVPAVEPRTVLNKKGKHVCMEEFLMDCALAMKLPGFGKNAISKKDGSKADLLAFDAWYACYLSNVAEQCANLPKVTDSDRLYAGLDRAMKMVAPYLSKAEASKVEALLSRGGYYDKPDRYNGNFMSNGGGKYLQIFNPAMPAIRHCYSGKPYPGIPVLDEPRFFNGDSWRQHWSKQDYPLLFSSFKPILRSNYSVAFAHCTEISPENFIQIHTITAKKLGLKSGDKVRLVSPNGTPTQGILYCDEGVAPGAVCVAHAYGHSAFGAEDRIIDGKKIAGIKIRAGGTAVNRMIPHDPTRPGKASLLNDYWAAGNCRTGIPVRLEKI